MIKKIWILVFFNILFASHISGSYGENITNSTDRAIAFMKSGDRRLFNTGIDPKAKLETGETPLHAALFYGYNDMIEKLIADGADVNAKFSDLSPLHRAASIGDNHLIHLLIKSGADVHSKDSVGLTPLDFANSAEAATLLLKAGAQVNNRGDSGTTPLYYAVSKALDDVVDILIQFGANVNAVPQWGSSPLYEALRLEEWAIADKLIKAGADINHKDDKGDTLLTQFEKLRKKEFMSDRKTDFVSERKNNLERYERIIAKLIEAGAKE